MTDAPELPTGTDAPNAEPAASTKGRLPEIPPLADWARAFAGGVKDTWADIVREGRKGTRRSHDSDWAKFEAKRKRRG